MEVYSIIKMAEIGNERNDESSSSSSDADSDGVYDHTSQHNHIQPYQFEPSPTRVVDGENPSCSGTSIERRKGNVEWCRCGNCRVVDTENESRCCKDDVPCEFSDEACICMNDNFATVCLHPEVLKATLGGLIIRGSDDHRK